MNNPAEWTPIEPQVNAKAEFFEILNDFADPLEILREAISNAIDAKASDMYITISVEDIDGNRRLVIVLWDNGHGMSENILKRDFWGLGFSPSRENKGTNRDTIGEKGHGTKIFLRSEQVRVETVTDKGSYESICNYPLKALTKGEIHKPEFRRIAPPWSGNTGTRITITGYNDNQRQKFRQNIVKDYILWFTKIGSIERQFGINKLADFKLHLQCLDAIDHETITFGHLFPEQNANIDMLFDQHEQDAVDYFVKYFTKEGRLIEHPEVEYQIFISIEGDQAKRDYNHMLRDRSRSDGGSYRVRDRYGLWLCKDYIPVERKNDWIATFGAGSGAFVLIHGFVNCQDLRLTANRGTIANTDPRIYDELQKVTIDFINEIDTELEKNSLFVLSDWQREKKTKSRERAEWESRTKNLKKKRIAELDGRLLVEPQTESELFGLFMTIYTLRPDLFAFQPLDYNTKQGIDIIGRNKDKSPITEGEHWYIELKYRLEKNNFNHSFQNLRWIICWDFALGVGNGDEFSGIDSETCKLEINTEVENETLYYLTQRKSRTKIQIIKLKEFLHENLNIEFSKSL